MTETTTGTYGTWRDDAFPGATLVLHHATGGPVAIGAFEGMPDGIERVLRSHREMSVAVAAAGRARSILGDYPDGFGQPRMYVPPSGGTPAARKAHLAEARVKALASVLSESDAYVATRRMETELGVAGNDAMVTWIRGHLEAVAARATGPEGAAEGANELAASAPGPATLLRRMEAAMRGLPQPPDGTLDIPGDGSHAGAVLGTVRVVSSALAPWPVEITVRVRHEIGSIEYEDGEVSFADIDVHLHHDPATWCPGRDGMAYGVEAVEAAVHDLFRRRGLGDHLPGWSESGRQTAFYGDMDAPPSLALALWPQLARPEGDGPRPR